MMGVLISVCTLSAGRVLSLLVAQALLWGLGCTLIPQESPAATPINAFQTRMGLTKITKKPYSIFSFKVEDNLFRITRFFYVLKMLDPYRILFQYRPFIPAQNRYKNIRLLSLALMPLAILMTI